MRIILIQYYRTAQFERSHDPLIVHIAYVNPFKLIPVTTSKLKLLAKDKKIVSGNRRQIFLLSAEIPHVMPL